jgi:predicted amidohydrolase
VVIREQVVSLRLFGVTTLLDPGSGGCYNFAGFTRFLMDGDW